MGFVLEESQYGDQTHIKSTCIHTLPNRQKLIYPWAHTNSSFHCQSTILFVWMKVFHFKERCLSGRIHLSLTILLFHLLSLCPVLLCTHTYTLMHAETHTQTHSHIYTGTSVGEGEPNPFSRHNFVWQEWQILFYDWMVFSTLLGTHSPIVQLATAITLPARLAQRRCLV